MSRKTKRQKKKSTDSKKPVSALMKHLHEMNVPYASIVSILTIIGVILGTISFFWQSYNSYVQHRDEQFIGVWTNPSEGCIDCDLGNDPERPIILTLRVKDGKISGVMDASAWLNNYREEKQKNEKKKKYKNKEEKFLGEAANIAMSMMHKYLSVNGKLTRFSSTIEIGDLVEGKWTLFGYGKIKLEDNVLRLEMTGKHFLGIPDTANLYRTENDDGGACKNVEPDAPWICNDPRDFIP